MSQEGGDNCEYQLVVGCTHEADLDKCSWCSKNKHHKDFVPFSSFELEQLLEEPISFPKRWAGKKPLILDIVRWLALLTVQLDVKYISIHRPLDGFGVDPNLRGQRAIIKGSGSVIAVIDKTLTTRKTQCPRVCSAPDADQFCGYFVVATAAHVVFDDEEAANTSIVFFFHDSQNRDLIEKCHGVNVQTTSKKGDFTEMLCVTHNRQFFNDLYNHVENKNIFTPVNVMTDTDKDISSKEGDLTKVLYVTHDRQFFNDIARKLKYLTNYVTGWTFTVPGDLFYPNDLPGVCYTFDYNFFYFPNNGREKFGRDVCEKLGLDRCVVNSNDQGVKVELNPNLINKFQLSGVSKTAELFLLCLDDSDLVLCTEKYLCHIMLTRRQIYLYKGTFAIQLNDDDSVVICRKSDPFPPPRMKDFLQGLDSARNSSWWLGPQSWDFYWRLTYDLIPRHLLFGPMTHALHTETTASVDEDQFSKEEMLVVHISHPHGRCKHISLGSTSEIETDSGFYRQMYQVATCPGSSGGPVWFIPKKMLQIPCNESEIIARLTGVPHSRHLGGKLNCSGSWTLYCPTIRR